MVPNFMYRVMDVMAANLTGEMGPKGQARVPKKVTVGRRCMSKGKVEDALFIRLCELFNELESISKGSSVIPKRRLHVRAISRWFDGFSGGDIYSVFRLLVPEIDLHRVYYLKEKKLAGLLCEILGLSDTGRGKSLTNWRVEDRHGKSQGDLSAVLFDIIRQAEHCAAPKHNIRDIDGLLNEIVACKSMNRGFTQFDASRGVPVLRQLYQSSTSMEIKWLTRIILKDLQVNIEPRVFFDAFHGWMWRIFSTKNDLKLACDTIIAMIQRGYTSTSKVSDAEFQNICSEFFRPQLGTNIAIMACGRAQGLQHVVERLGGHKCFVEEKFDGERLQAHLCKAWPEKIRIFSKSGRNSTQDRFRCHGQLLKALKFKDPQNTIESCIVEGELLVFNEEAGQIDNFGTVQDLQAWKSTYRCDIVSGRRHYIVMLFDLLYLNGQDLTFKPLSYRRALLETLVVQDPKFVQLTKVHEVDFGLETGLERLKELYLDANRNRKEGLIIKKMTAPYLPGNRSEWLKLKKDYIEGFGDTAEFAVVGLAHGKSGKGLLDTMIIGALTNKVELLQDWGVKPHFLLVFTVSQGLNEDETLLFHEKMKSLHLLKPGDTSDSLSYAFAAGFRHDLDFIVQEPFLVELLGSGFVKERGQPHHVLRFPRIKKVYFNRTLHDSISFQELQEMAKASFETGATEETVRLAEDLTEHAERQKASGRRAPGLARPHRLVFSEEKLEDIESPSKLLKTMTIRSPLDQLRSDYFFHLPVPLDEHGDLTARLETLGLETLYHLIAVASCENRKCIVVTTDRASVEHVRQSLRELGCTREVFQLTFDDLQVLLDNPEAFSMSLIVPL